MVCLNFAKSGLLCQIKNIVISYQYLIMIFRQYNANKDLKF